MSFNFLFYWLTKCTCVHDVVGALHTDGDDDDDDDGGGGDGGDSDDNVDNKQ